MPALCTFLTKLCRSGPPWDEAPEPKLNGKLAEIWKDLPIQYVVQANDTFIVFLDRNLVVDWSTNDEHKIVDQKQHNEILNTAAVLETMPCEGLPPSIRSNFKRLIGESLVRCFDNDYSGAKSMLKNAAKYVAARSEETSRDWYLSASFLGTLPFVGLGVVLWVKRAAFLALLTPPVFWLAMATTAGALGALLSVITRAGKQRLDYSAGRRLHFLEGASRIAAGAISALMVSTAVRAGLVFSSLVSSRNTIPVMITLAFVSGTTERLAAHLVSDLGAKSTGARRSRKDDPDD